MRFSIKNAAIVYFEGHQVATDAVGYFTAVIGLGSSNDDFFVIDCTSGGGSIEGSNSVRLARVSYQDTINSWTAKGFQTRKVVGNWLIKAWTICVDVK